MSNRIDPRQIRFALDNAVTDMLTPDGIGKGFVSIGMAIQMLEQIEADRELAEKAIFALQDELRKKEVELMEAQLFDAETRGNEE